MSRLRALEDLKSAICAEQAKAALALDIARKAVDAAAGIPADQRGRGVAAEIALARRESPHQGSRLLGMARVLVSDMPHTLAALESGVLNEWRATLIVRETVCLDTPDRQAVDLELAADTGGLDGAGSQGITNRARAIAQRLDPHAAITRARKAVAERNVSCRPAPDTMAYLTALLPAAEAITAYAALSRHADSRVATGESDGLGRGQLMADALVERLTTSSFTTPSTAAAHAGTEARAELAWAPGNAEGNTANAIGVGPAGRTAGETAASASGETGSSASDATAGSASDATAGSASDAMAGSASHRTACAVDRGGSSRRIGAQRIEVQLIMTDRTLLQGDSEPAHLAGYGTIPAQLARDLLRNQQEDDTAGAWLRRVYTAPGTGDLIAMDSRARLFPPALRRLIHTRDATCRTPYCDAPIRHTDHIVAWHTTATSSAATTATSGETTTMPTTSDNGQGLCEKCNYTKELTGWTTHTKPGPRHTVEQRTPTGHAYTSTAPPLPGTRDPAKVPADASGPGETNAPRPPLAPERTSTNQSLHAAVSPTAAAPRPPLAPERSSTNPPPHPAVPPDAATPRAPEAPAPASTNQPLRPSEPSDAAPSGPAHAIVDLIFQRLAA